MNISENLIKEIIEKVLAETLHKSGDDFVKHIDPSGIIGIKTSTDRKSVV